MRKKPAKAVEVLIPVLYTAVCALGGCSQPAQRSAASATIRLAEYPAVDASFLNAVEWRFVGPPRGGRAPAVAGDPRDPLVFYFGASHGGVWKTEDAGINWRNVSDGFFKTAPIGAIDVSLSNPNIIYVGTGEALTRQDETPGDGVYKSTDGGKTWTNVGLQETHYIARIRIHPRNPDILYVAAAGDMFGTNPERGIFKSTDGGKTWQRVLFKSERASALDLSMDMTNPEVLYASLDQFQRLPWDEVSGGPDSGLYKTTDGARTWTELTRNPGLPTGVVGKIGVSVSPVRPARVWAMVEADDGALFRSDDAGRTWQRMQERPGWQRDAASYMHVVADTQDPDTVYTLNQDGFWKSTDAGTTFVSIPMPHGDQHALWIDPNNPRRMIEGNDGGATITLNGGASWSTLYNQPTAALYGLAIDNQVPYRLYGAQLDNSHISTPSRTDDAAITWAANESIEGGEGGQTAVKPDGSVVYAGDRTAIVRYDRASGQAPTISVWPENDFGNRVKDLKYRMYFTFPVLLSPHDPGVLYTAGNIFFRSTDEGDSWQAISPDLTRNRKEKMQEFPGRPITSFHSSLATISLAQSIAESPLEKGELWFGSDDTTVQVTRNGGQTWENVTPKDLPEWTTIATIDVSPHDRGTAYIAAHRYKVSDRTTYLYKTTDYGQTWQRITNGIRQNDFTRVIREDPIRRGLLFAGTETGVYVSFDAGTSWQSLQRNLPVVPVYYMLVKDDDLVLGTHGRGFWIMDNITALRQLTRDVTAEPVYLFDAPPTYRYLPARSGGPGRTFRPGIQVGGVDGDVVSFEDRQGADGRITRTYLNAGQNPPRGAMIEYYLEQPPSAEATLAILDEKGQEIQRFSSRGKGASSMPANAGTNRFVWDLRYPNAREVPLDPRISIRDAARASAPVAPPGRYQVRMNIEGKTYQKPFEVRKDPRVKATEADLQEHFAFMTKIRDRLSEVTDTVTRLREARTQLEGRARPEGGAAAQPSPTLEKLAAIEAVLTRVAGPHPYMLPAKGIDYKLAALSGVVARADARPTKPMYAVFEVLSERLANAQRQLNEVLETEKLAITTTSGEAPPGKQPDSR